MTRIRPVSEIATSCAFTWRLEWRLVGFNVQGIRGVRSASPPGRSRSGVPACRPWLVLAVLEASSHFGRNLRSPRRVRGRCHRSWTMLLDIWARDMRSHELRSCNRLFSSLLISCCVCLSAASRSRPRGKGPVQSRSGHLENLG